MDGQTFSKNPSKRGKSHHHFSTHSVMNLLSIGHTHTLHSPSTQRQHLTQSVKVTKLIFKNDFHSPISNTIWYMNTQTNLK